MSSEAKTSGKSDAISAKDAFVVQLRARSADSPAELAGRVEYIPTGQASYFEGAEELLDFVMRVRVPKPA